MSASAAPPPEPTNRFAVPLEELEAVRLSQTRTVQEVGDSSRPYAPDTSPCGGAAGDGDGE